MIPSSSQVAEISSRIMLYLSVGRYEAAEKLLDEQIQQNPYHHGELFNLLGFVFHKQSQFSKALNCFEKAWQSDPSFVEARLNYAVTLCDLGHYPKAQATMKEAGEYADLQLSQTHLTLQRLAQSHEELGDDYQKCGMELRAQNEYQKSLGLCKDNPQVRIKLARIFIRAHNYERAQKELEATLTDPEFGEEARCWLGILSLQQGDRDQTLSHWQSYEKPRSRLLQAYLSLALHWKSAPKTQSPSTPPTPTSDWGPSSPPSTPPASHPSWQPPAPRPSL